MPPRMETSSGGTWRRGTGRGGRDIRCFIGSLVVRDGAGGGLDAWGGRVEAGVERGVEVEAGVPEEADGAAGVSLSWVEGGGGGG